MSGTHESSEIHNRVMIVKKYKAFGMHVKEVRDVLEEDHGIIVSYDVINHDFVNINNGKYAESYLDLLLDVNYPELFETALSEMVKNMDEMKRMAHEDGINPNLKAKLLIAHTKLHMGILETLHKGAVIREMKKLSTKAKILVREIMQQDSMLKKRGELSLISSKNADLQKRVVEFDENLEMVENGMEPSAAEDELNEF